MASNNFFGYSASPSAPTYGQSSSTPNFGTSYTVSSVPQGASVVAYSTYQPSPASGVTSYAVAPPPPQQVQLQSSSLSSASLSLPGSLPVYPSSSYALHPSYSRGTHQLFPLSSPSNYSNISSTTLPPSFAYSVPSNILTAKPSLYVQSANPGSTISITSVLGSAWGHGLKEGRLHRSFKTPRLSSKPCQLHYCEVCKISCAGPQTYKEHLEGQKHKKKESSCGSGGFMSTTSTTTNSTAATMSSTAEAANNSCYSSSSSFSNRGGNVLRCELCDVTCTGSDAYAAHIRGAKHQKVVKLHTKLGKPIPSGDPILLFKERKDDSILRILCPSSSSRLIRSGEESVAPVGHDYIEENTDPTSKILSFHCKLCDCRFNDPNAKEMHMKGRKHRLMYKKKVNPALIVDVKPSLRQRKIAEERAKRSRAKEEFWRRRQEEFSLMEEAEAVYWSQQRRFWRGDGNGRNDDEDENDEEEKEESFHHYNKWFKVSRRFGPPPSGFFFPLHRKPESIDDRHVLAKHAEIYPSEIQLYSFQKLVSSTEKALKFVSDALSGNGGESRVLKGVMKVGVLAKGLLLKGDTVVRLVVLCGEKPTIGLLNSLVDALSLSHFATEENIKIEKRIEESAFVVSSSSLSVLITLTSPCMRNELPETSSSSISSSNSDSSSDSKTLLNSSCCLEALAALRHAKWFTARAAGRQSCVMIIRIFRDLLSRVPTWKPLQLFPLELMIEKILASAGFPLSPGEAFRRVFEAVSDGLLLPDAPGILDPCEKEPMDSTRDLTSQEREDITASAQTALRLIAFRQIYKVLGMEILPPPKYSRVRLGKKRRRDVKEMNENEEREGEETNENQNDSGKKNKKENKVDKDSILSSSLPSSSSSEFLEKQQETKDDTDEVEVKGVMEVEVNGVVEVKGVMEAEKSVPESQSQKTNT